MENIIIPTDFTAASKRVIDYGVQLANDVNKKIQLVYVIDSLKYKPELQPYRGVNTNIPDKEQVEANVKLLFRELLAELDEKFDRRPEVKVTLKSGVFADVIIEWAELESTFLVLLTGEEKKELLKRDLSGTEGRIMREASAPVWIVPSHARYRRFSKVIYATRLKPADIEALKHVTDFVRVFNAQVFAIHVEDQLDFDERIKKQGFETMARRETNYELIDFQTIKGNNSIKAVNAFASRINAELIVIMKEDKTLMEEIISDDKVKKMVVDTRLPVAVYHEVEKEGDVG